MNQVTNEQKDRVLKVLAVFGFLAIVVLGVFLAVQIVRLMPQAFSSLASIADVVYNYNDNEELHVETEKSTVNAGETFLISWDALNENGTYTFTYTCEDGISVDIRDNTGSFYTVNCGERISLGGDATLLPVTVASERSRFSDVTYEIALCRKGETEPLTVSENMISVVNASIPTSSDIVGGNDNTDDEVASDTDDETGNDESPDQVTATPTTPPVHYETIVTRPVSDPNGSTDLRVRLLAVGELDNDGNFQKRANLDEDANAAFQFEVTNIGTKISDEWDFEATLTSGTEYDAPKQSPLMPQERAIFTLGYDNVGDSGIQSIGVTVRGGDDVNTSNNSFTWAVSVVE